MNDLTLHDLLARNLEGRADHPAIVDGAASVTYGDLHDRAAALAGWLADRGVERGDRAVVQLRKSVEEVVALFAIARLGAVVVDLNLQWTAPQVLHVLRDAAPRAMILEGRRSAEILEPGLPDGLDAVLVRGPAPPDDRLTLWETLPKDAARPNPAGCDADLAALLYTSGSTGRPKGVMLTHRNLVLGARSVASYLSNRPEDRLLSLLPFSFDYGLSQLTTMALVGGTLVLQGVAMPVEIARALADHEITGFAAVPSAWTPLVRYLVEEPAAFPALRYLTNSGGSLPRDVLESMPEVFPGADIHLMYGLTEAFRSTSLPPARYRTKMGSIGQAVPHAEVFVVDPGRGVCGPGETGELVHRGGLVSQGYWNDPDATAKRIRPCPELASVLGDEAVCWSGDLVRADEDGDLWFVARRDGMIKSSGFRISPEEVEDLASRSPLVDRAVAFGVPHEELGQVVHLAVVPADERPFDEEAFSAHCRRTMPSYMIPAAVHRWAGELPLTPHGKIDRRVVAERIGDGDG